MLSIPFKVLGWIVKASLFAGLVLILGNVLHIGGKTVSDQVRTSLSHAEQIGAIDHVKNFADDVTDRAKRAVNEVKKPAGRHGANAAPVVQNRKVASEKNPISENPRKPTQKLIQAETNNTESILASERQQLRTLIRDLNNSTEKLTAN
jgi:hypothetical protein